MNKEQFNNTLQRVNDLRSKFGNPNGQSPLTTAEIIEYLSAIRDLDAGLKEVYRDLPLDPDVINGLGVYVTEGNATINGIEENIKKAHQAASDQNVIDMARLEAALKEKETAFNINYQSRQRASQALSTLVQSHGTKEQIASLGEEMKNLASREAELNSEKSLAQDRIDQCEMDFQKVAGNFQSQLNSVAQRQSEHYAAQQAEFKAAGKALSDALAVKESVTTRIGEKRSSIVEKVSKPQQGKVSKSPLGRLLEDEHMPSGEKRNLLHALCVPAPGVETFEMIAAIPRKELELVYPMIITAYKDLKDTVSTSGAAIEAKADLEKVIELLAGRKFSPATLGHDNMISFGTKARGQQTLAVEALNELLVEYVATIATLQEKEANEAVVVPAQVSSMPGWMSNPGLMTAGVVAIAAVVAAYNAFSSPAEAVSTVASSGPTIFSGIVNATAEVAEAAANQVANIAP